MLVRAGGFREAIETFNKIKTISPDVAPRYFYNFAYACYRLGAVAEAKQLIAKGRPYIKEPAELTAIDRLSQILETTARRPVPAAVIETENVPPRVVRRIEVPTTSPAPLPDSPALPVAEARLDSVECIDQLARLHVSVSGTAKIFVITDTASVTIGSGNGAPVEFQCGKQTPRGVRISYEPSDLPGVAGKVRALDFY